LRIALLDTTGEAVKRLGVMEEIRDLGNEHYEVLLHGRVACILLTGMNASAVSHISTRWRHAFTSTSNVPSLWS
jgi:hypothetical protein